MRLRPLRTVPEGESLPASGWSGVGELRREAKDMEDGVEGRMMGELVTLGGDLGSSRGEFGAEWVGVM